MSKPDIVENYSRERDFLASSIPGMNSAGKVPTLNASELTEEAFKKVWVDRNETCLIKGAISHWPAVQKWGNKEYWLRTCENKKVTVARNNGHELREKTLIGLLQMNFHDAMNRLYNNVDFSFYVQDVMPEAFKDIAGFNFLPSPKRPNNYIPNRLLIQRRAFTTWHAHSYDEFLLCQVKGAKKVMLFPSEIPSDIEHVTAFLRNERYLNGESLDMTVDFKPVIAELEEGDALYIPPFWHHAVHPQHSEVNFCVIHCWASPIHKFGYLSNYFVRQNYKDLIWPINKNSLKVPLLVLGGLVSLATRAICSKVSRAFLSA